MKSPIDFFEELILNYGDFLIEQAKLPYSTFAGEERIRKFVKKIMLKTKRYNDKYCKEKKQ